MMQLDNNTILITGGASGIGLALAKAYLHHNSTVIICGRDTKKLIAVQKELPDIHTLTCDITSDEDLTQLKETIKKEYKDINILINNAGIQYSYNFLDDKNHNSLISEEIETNFLSHLKLMDYFIPLLKHRPNAAIINVSSALAFVPKESSPVYCATKAAMHIFTKSLRYQLEKSPIKVFEIIPPLVDTKMTQRRGTGKISPQKLAQEALKNIKKDNYEIKIGKSKVLLILHRCLPFLADKIIRKG